MCFAFSGHQRNVSSTISSHAPTSSSHPLASSDPEHQILVGDIPLVVTDLEYPDGSRALQKNENGMLL